MKTQNAQSLRNITQNVMTNREEQAIEIAAKMFVNEIMPAMVKEAEQGKFFCKVNFYDNLPAYKNRTDELNWLIVASIVEIAREQGFRIDARENSFEFDKLVYIVIRWDLA